MTIARFNGKMEFGPRGLGNRSIIANASNTKIIKKINHAIKMRDFWMPFAASILTSRINDYLVDSRNSPYMIMAFDTTEKRDEIVAGIHPFDFTCRPQTVDASYNANYEKVLKAFESKTSIGGVLNTSFNLHGEPIVNDINDAWHVFENSELDALWLDRHIIEK